MRFVVFYHSMWVLGLEALGAPGQIGSFLGRSFMTPAPSSWCASAPFTNLTSEAIMLSGLTKMTSVI
jgi:hypothetical protein